MATVGELTIKLSWEGAKQMKELERRRVEKAAARKARCREVGQYTRPAWDAIAEVLRKQGYKWCFNDTTVTHRRVKLSISAGRYLENHLSVLATEEKYGVTVVVEFPPGLTYNPLLPNHPPRERGEVKLRIYPYPREHNR